MTSRSLLLIAWLLGGRVGAGEPPGPPAQTPEALAAWIDAHLAASFKENKVESAPQAGDAEFLRRVYLDLLGRIPTVAEARAFLDDRADDKRGRLVEYLLSSAGHTAHVAQVWRALLVPQATINLPTQHLGVSVEAWLREQLRAGHRDDRIVRDLLTARLDYLDWTGDKKAQPVATLSPVGFYQANDLKPETVAAAVGRIFLGLRLGRGSIQDQSSTQ
jgi:Protein of unknown function (DUF1549)